MVSLNGHVLPVTEPHELAVPAPPDHVVLIVLGAFSLRSAALSSNAHLQPISCSDPHTLNLIALLRRGTFIRWRRAIRCAGHPGLVHELAQRAVQARADALPRDPRGVCEAARGADEDVRLRRGCH